MRKIIFIILSVVLVCNTSFAQDVKNESKSKSIEFMAECGNLIKKEFYDLPGIKGITNQVLIITDVLSGKRLDVCALKHPIITGVHLIHM